MDAVAHVSRWICIREMRGCEDDGWEIALSEVRESEIIIKVLVIDGDGRVRVCVEDSCRLLVSFTRNYPYPGTFFSTFFILGTVKQR